MKPTKGLQILGNLIVKVNRERLKTPALISAKLVSAWCQISNKGSSIKENG